MFLQGMKVMSSPLAVKLTPNRQHKKKRGQTDSYHRKVQKKWTKRFGTFPAPCAYRLGDGTLVVHPNILEQLKRVSEFQ